MTSSMRILPALISIASFLACDEKTARQEDSSAALSRADSPQFADGSPAQLQGSIPTWTEFAILQNRLAVMSDQTSLSRFRSLLVAPRAEVGQQVREMFEQRRAFGVPNGVDVLVLHQTGAEARVRIDEPNRVYSGREGWVPTEWLRRKSSPGPANPSLPRYEILEKMGVTIEVLVASLRPSGQPANFSRHLLEITRREGAAVANFYSTREAYDANVNGGTNPRTIDRAMKRGYLGRVENGVFQPSPY